MTHKSETRRGWQAGRASESILLAGVINSEDTPQPRALQPKPATTVFSDRLEAWARQRGVAIACDYRREGGNVPPGAFLDAALERQGPLLTVLRWTAETAFFAAVADGEAET